jgi:hypothetical protein
MRLLCRRFPAVCIIVAVLALAGCAGLGRAGTQTAESGGSALGQRTKTSGCQVRGPLQDPACTPGAVFAVTRAQICDPGYAKSVRDVPVQEKDQVYAEYGVSSHRPGEYEVDHLVSLEIGGSNDIANLWPEAASPKPGYHEKDRYENYLHAQVCSGAMPLAEAQQRIATDWLQYWSAAGQP